MRGQVNLSEIKLSAGMEATVDDGHLNATQLPRSQADILLLRAQPLLQYDAPSASRVTDGGLQLLMPDFLNKLFCDE